jgi:TRAP-type mannitol/chloroaromatic compound transport system permease small subunit
MPKSVRLYVRYVDAVNRVVGRVVMYMIFAMIGLLLFSSISKTFFLPLIWTLEMAQFSMAAYYLLGGAYSMQLDAHVRMDLVYSRWTPKRKAYTDSITAFCLVFYLIMLLYGGFSSTAYALQYGETSYSSWSPYMAPIKVIMTFGVGLMLLQAIAIFFKDLARATGRDIDGDPGPEEQPV